MVTMFAAIVTVTVIFISNQRAPQHLLQKFLEKERNDT